MRIGYLVHNLNDPAVERRCVMLERGGAIIALAGFCRDRELSEAIDRRDPLLLGRSEDAAFLKRAISTLTAALFHRQLKGHFQEADIIVARNLEQLAIARSLGGERPLVYECLDIHRSLVGSGLAARLVQRLEALLLPRVDMLITSSPAFVRNHFAQTNLAAPIELLENKVLVEDEASIKQSACDPTFPIRIGWFGMLRCKKTLTFLAKLVAASHGKIEVLIAGKPSRAELPDIEQVVDRTPGMEFVGPYRYSDLPALYRRCHFAWTIDWFEEGLNSSWLLPNRLYEPLAYGVVPIALRDVEVGRWLATNKAGFLVSSGEEASERLMAMEPEELASLQMAARLVDRAKLVADQAACDSLVETLAEVRRR